MRPLLERRETGEDFVYSSPRERAEHPGRYRYEVPTEQFGPLPRAMIEARLRLELADTAFDDPSSAMTRVRLRLDSGRYRESVNYLLEFQDRRSVMGSDDSSAGFDFRQAYVLFALPRSIWGLKFGRQEIDLGTGRLLGANWHDQLDPTHDAVRLTVANRWGMFDPRQCAWRLDVFVGQPALDHDRPDTAGAYYSDWRAFPFRLDGGLVLASSGPDSVTTVSAAAVGEGFGRAKGFELDAEAALQFGRVGGEPHLAGLLSGRLGYVFPTPWAVRLEAGFESASGDEDLSDGRSRTFLPPSPGDLRGRLGLMELVGLSNSVVLSLAAGFEPVDDLRLRFAARWLRLHEAGGGWIGPDGDVRPISPDGAALGLETSLAGTYTFVTERGKEVRLEGGYAVFEPSSGLEVDAMQKLYLQAALRF